MDYPIEIDIYFTCHDKEIVEEIRKIDPSRVYSHSYMKDYIVYNVKEFYEKIQNTIENRQKWLNQYENELKNFDKDLEESKKILNQVYNLFNKLNENLDHGYYNQKEILENTIKFMYL